MLQRAGDKTRITPASVLKTRSEGRVPHTRRGGTQAVVTEFFIVRIQSFRYTVTEDLKKIAQADRRGALHETRPGASCQ